MKIGKRYLPLRSIYREATDKQFKRLGLKDEVRDAFTHAFSLALAARDWGGDAAKIMGDLNEQWRPGNPADEWFMDRHNNTLGIQTGQNKPVGTGDDIIADEIKQRLDRAQLITHRQETGLPHEPLGEPDGGSELEILQEAVARMRNTKQGLPANTPISAEQAQHKSSIREKAIARGAKLLGPHRYDAKPLANSILAYFRKK